MATFSTPIWDKVETSLGTNDSALYRISKQNGSSWDVIYTGRAYKKPGDTHIRLYMNDIVADYISSVFPNDGVDLHCTPGGSATFKISVYQQGTQTWQDLPGTHEYINNWSYTNDKTGIMAEPINFKIDPEQPLVYSTKGVVRVSFLVNYADGTTETKQINTESSGGTSYIDLSNLGKEVVSVVVQGKTYKAEGCHRYILYYLNSLGGYDSLLIDGNTLEKDSLTRHIAHKERGRQNYTNEVVKEYTFHTGWMSDEESSRMHNLLNSTEVYLYDKTIMEFIPVVLTNTETEYKTYKGNGGQMVNYEITAEVAETRIRK